MNQKDEKACEIDQIDLEEEHDDPALALNPLSKNDAPKDLTVIELASMSVD